MEIVSFVRISWELVRANVSLEVVTSQNTRNVDECRLLGCGAAWIL
jgi:hypothetical protein